MNTNPPNPAVLRELLNPDTPLDQIAERHDLPIPDLLAILESDDFHQAAAALARAESIRTAALAPVRRERALRSLTALASEAPTSATHAESVRRAATAILKETRTDTDAPAREARPAPPPTALAATPAGGLASLDPAALIQTLASPEMAEELDTLLAELENAAAHRRPPPDDACAPCAA